MACTIAWQQLELACQVGHSPSDLACVVGFRRCACDEPLPTIGLCFVEPMLDRSCFQHAPTLFCLCVSTPRRARLGARARGAAAVPHFTLPTVPLCTAGSRQDEPASLPSSSNPLAVVVEPRSIVSSLFVRLLRPALAVPVPLLAAVNRLHRVALGHLG
ncbi:hypothetical protein ERJ75_000900600 [Trypanosoma vivax]|nr:hypothetical protein ERJ75_000900600 [Trypanosoma vivax]